MMNGNDHDDDGNGDDPLFSSSPTNGHSPTSTAVVDMNPSPPPVVIAPSRPNTLHMRPPPPLHELPTSEEAHNTYHPEFMFCGACSTCKHEEEERNGIGNGVQTTPEGRVWTASVVDDDEQHFDDVEMNSNASATEAKVSLVRTQLLVPTMMTESQTHVVKTLLKELSGVHKVSTHLITNTVDVDHGASTTLSDMVDTLQRMGFKGARPQSNSSAPLDMPLARSQFHVQGICCTSECPTIQSIVEQLPSVSKIQINITTKNVYVEYDPHCLSALEIAQTLTKQGFRSRILRDGALPKAKPAEVGRTTLHMTKVLHPNDIPIIQERLAAVQGVKRVGVNLVESVVFCEHDVSKVSAQQLSQHLAETPGSESGVTSNEYLNSIAADAMEEITQRTCTTLTMARSKFVESTLLISNLSLQHLHVLEKAIRQNYVSSQLRAFYPHVPSKTIKLEHNPELLDATAVCAVLQRYGMETSVAIDGSEENLALPLLEDYESDAIHPTLHGNMIRDDHASLHLNVLLSGFFWALSLLSYFGGKMEYFEYAGLFSVLFGIPPIAAKAFRTVRRCQFDANCMMVVAAVGALGLGEFDEAASVAFLFAVSEYLEARATERARKALAAIVTLRPDHAHVVHPTTKEVIIVPAEKVPVGSVLSVRTGDKIATDGIVVEGMSAVDESSLTGEAVPVTKKVHDAVSGGSINIGQEPLLIQTTTSVEDSAVSRLIRLVEEAQANRSPTEKLVDRFAKKYTPIVLFMALLMCTVPWFFGKDTGRYWTLNGLIIIVIACPCALTISTPVTYAAGLAATAQRGIIVKGGASLESLGSVEKVILDKTGTLTNGKFVLNKLEAVGNTMTREEVLGLLALIEAPSSHPLSATLVHAARAEGVSIPRHLKMEHHTILRGEGVSAVLEGGKKKVYVGNRRLFTRLGMYDTLSYYKTTTEEWARNGGTVGFIGMEDTGIIGAFCVTDDVRPEAAEVVRQLHEGGIEVIMLTGDSEGAAHAVARKVGLRPSCVHAQLLPEEKLHHVGSMIQPKSMRKRKCCGCGCSRKSSLVLMCGDGINDAPALAVADVGVAMGEGASLAMEMSDITLMDSNIGKLLYTIKMGTRVVMTIQENIILSLVAKLLVVGLTFGGYMTLLSAIAADVGVMLIVTLNGMKLLPTGKEEMFVVDYGKDDYASKGALKDTKRIALGSPSYNPVKQQQRQSGTSVLELV